ncbi:MAG: hypothetical protein KGJ13_13265, partial [Patescibacteria group bacterium]|nr:hypothetical protein [Patescibacteria group bacterium]
MKSKSLATTNIPHSAHIASTINKPKPSPPPVAPHACKATPVAPAAAAALLAAVPDEELGTNIGVFCPTVPDAAVLAEAFGFCTVTFAALPNACI